MLLLFKMLYDAVLHIHAFVAHSSHEIVLQLEDAKFVTQFSLCNDKFVTQLWSETCCTRDGNLGLVRMQRIQVHRTAW